MERQSIIEAVRAATSLVFSTMMDLPVEMGPAFVETATPSTTEGVMAFVGLAGPWVGSGVISFDSEMACRLSSLFLMAEANTVNEDVLDAVGEIANMVFGNFKTAAEAAVGGLGLSVPTVIYGKHFVSRSLGKSEWIVLPLRCPHGEFQVRIWFTPVAESNFARLIVNQVHAV
jgi:chemotaxis protein CheX